MGTQAVRIGLVGCGAFARQAVAQFLKLPDVRVTALCDPDPEAARLGTSAFGALGVPLAEMLVLRDDVDLVYIASPPGLHHRHALTAMRARKHVLCEAPLGITKPEADELVATACAVGRLLVATLTPRYNPVYDAVKRMLAGGLLGDVLHGSMESHTSDAARAPEHWFWDPKLGGGLFVQQAVHGLDPCEGWLGPGQVVAAQASRRDSGLEDQVQCTLAHPHGVHASHYYGCAQPAPLTEQITRLVCERGTITLHGWPLTRIEIRALVTHDTQAHLLSLLPGAHVETLATYTGDRRQLSGRHKPFEADALIALSHGDSIDGPTRFGELLRSLLADQLAWIRDPSHPRRVTEEHARRAVALADAARQLAAPTGSCDGQ